MLHPRGTGRHHTNSSKKVNLDGNQALSYSKLGRMGGKVGKKHVYEHGKLGCEQLRASMFSVTEKVRPSTQSLR